MDIRGTDGTRIPRKRRAACLALAAAGVLTGCGGQTPGTRLRDMSAEQHEATATREEATAEAHENRYDPGAAERQRRCAAGRTGGGCWTSIVNPTEKHRREAEEHRRRAAKHRAAADALRAAEARACVGIADIDRDMSPFNHREDIARVEPFNVDTLGRTRELKGAVVVFRAVPGMTAEWLQRVVDCHLARNAVMGDDLSDMPYCPLALKGVAGRVRSAGDGFAVEITSDDPAVAAEILRRAQALVAEQERMGELIVAPP